MASSTKRPPKKARIEFDPTTFGFNHCTFVSYMMKECPWILDMTGAHAILHNILQEGERYMAESKCTIQKGLERACNVCTNAFGPSAHQKFWKIAKFLSGGNTRNADDTARLPYVLAPCLAGDVVVTIDPSGNAAWVLPNERWLATPRWWTNIAPDIADQQRRMNFQMLECIVQHQLEHSSLWTAVPDFDLIFMALTFAKRCKLEAFSASTASHIASIAIRYHMDESRSDSTAFKGLRRWRNVSSKIVMDITIACLQGHRESPRHHQLWHLQRIAGEQGIQTSLGEAMFLLLIGVVNDHIFASIPPEDAAEAIVATLMTPHLRTAKNDYDIKRLHEALKQPRSPYLHVIFPEFAHVPLEVWMEKVSVPPT